MASRRKKSHRKLLRKTSKSQRTSSRFSTQPSPPPTQPQQDDSLFSSEVRAKLRGAADKVLAAIESNPEQAFANLEKIGDQIERTAAYYRKHPEEAKKAMKFTALAGLAKAIRKGLES